MDIHFTYIEPMLHLPIGYFYYNPTIIHKWINEVNYKTTMKLRNHDKIDCS
jgi:hypothetical protein